MITYVVSDIFQSPSKVLVNTVNTVGVMGKGIALEYKKIYPEMFERYRTLCEQNLFDIGKLWIYKTPHKWILNFPTKKHWRQKSKLEYIEAGLKKFVETYDNRGIQSISFPMLGCGNGELDWETQVRPMMEEYLNPLPINIFVHLYEVDDPYAPEHRNIDKIKQWLRTEPQNLSTLAFWDDFLEVIELNQSLSLNNDKSNIELEYISYSDALLIRPEQDSEIIIERDQILDLWQQLRLSGYIAPNEFPSGLGNTPDIVVSMFSKLDYIEPVLIAWEGSPKRVGLRLVPVTSEKPIQTKLPLFDVVPDVQ